MSPQAAATQLHNGKASSDTGTSGRNGGAAAAAPLVAKLETAVASLRAAASAADVPRLAEAQAAAAAVLPDVAVAGGTDRAQVRC